MDNNDVQVTQGEPRAVVNGVDLGNINALSPEAKDVLVLLTEAKNEAASLFRKLRIQEEAIKALSHTLITVAQPKPEVVAEASVEISDQLDAERH